MGAGRRRLDRRLIGLGAAVGDVVADRAVQERGVLGDDADRRAQALLAHVGDILAVDEDPAAFKIVEAQQQVDEGRFAGAGAAHEPDPLAGPHGQRQLVDDPRALAVMEAHPIESHLAAGDRERHGIGLVDDGQGLGDRHHALLNLSDILEDAVDLPHDPAGHVDDADGEAGREGDGAEPDRSGLPQQYRHRAGRAEHQRIEDGDRQRHRGDGAQLAAEGAELGIYGLADIDLLTLGVGEHLHGRDVGVAVDDAAGEERIRLRHRLRQAAQPRHEPAQNEDVADHPDEEGRREPQVGLGEEQERAAGIDAGEPERVDHIDDGFAQGRSGLHDAARQPPGEIVLEEGQALADHVAVRLPAHQRRELRHDRLPHHEIVQGGGERAGEQHNASIQASVGPYSTKTRSGLVLPSTSTIEPT